MTKATELFVDEDIEKIKKICKLFNGKVVRIIDEEKNE